MFQHPQRNRRFHLSLPRHPLLQVKIMSPRNKYIYNCFLVHPEQGRGTEMQQDSPLGEALILNICRCNRHPSVLHLLWSQVIWTPVCRWIISGYCFNMNLEIDLISQLSFCIYGIRLESITCVKSQSSPASGYMNWTHHLQYTYALTGVNPISLVQYFVAFSCQINCTLI